MSKHRCQGYGSQPPTLQAGCKVGNGDWDQSFKSIQQDRQDSPPLTACPPDIGCSWIPVAVAADIRVQCQPA